MADAATWSLPVLLGSDILVRDVSGYPMLNDYFRVSVGTPKESDILIKALREIFAGTESLSEDSL